MLLRKTARGVAAVLTAAVLLVCSGCELKTKIMFQPVPPEQVLSSFFTELKNGNFEACDQYLADNATFVIKDDTEYNFLDHLVDTTIQYLDYQSLGDAEIDNIHASQRISVRSLNQNDMLVWMKANIVQAEFAYLEKTGKQFVDKESMSPEDLSDVLSMAIDLYARDAKLIENDITVHYIFTEGEWKIVAESDLIAAVFGGDIDA